MAKSSAGKRIYLCPHCYSDQIPKCSMHGHTSFWCIDCRYWGPWNERMSVNPHRAVHFIAVRRKREIRKKYVENIKYIFSFKWVCKVFKA